MPTRTVPADIPARIDALPPLLAGLARRGQVRACRKGTLLIEEGDGGDTLHIVLSGRVRVFSLDSRGDRELTFGNYGPGEYVGEMSLDGGPRSASVIATETTICAVVTRRTVQAYIAEQPEFALLIIDKLARRARAATLTARQIALNDVYGRIRQLLQDGARPLADGSALFEQRMTQREMAGQIGCSREMVTRVMKDLLTGSWVDAVSPPLRLLRTLPQRW